MFISKRRITASEDVAPVEVAPEAAELLFEAEDVAELVAEITEEVVDVAVDGEDVIFSVGEDEFVVTPDEDIEEVESSRKVGRRAVRASRRPARRSSRARRVAASRSVRRVHR